MAYVKVDVDDDRDGTGGEVIPGEVVRRAPAEVARVEPGRLASPADSTVGAMLYAWMVDTPVRLTVRGLRWTAEEAERAVEWGLDGAAGTRLSRVLGWTALAVGLFLVFRVF